MQITNKVVLIWYFVLYNRYFQRTLRRSVFQHATDVRLSRYLYGDAELC